MTTLTTRSSKGSELSYGEGDANIDRDVQIKTTTYACLVSDNRSVIEGNHASTPFTVTLGDAATMAAADTGDYEVTIANIGAAAVTVARAGADTIDGAATSIVLQQYSSVTLKVNAATDGYNSIAQTVTGIANLTASEVAILDGATLTTTEINALDSDQAATTPTVAGGDSFVMDDADVGTVKVDIDNVDTYLAQTTKTLTNKTLTTPTIGDASNIVSASTTVEGVAELATDAETITGTDTSRVCTPANLQAKLDDYAAISSGNWTPTLQDLTLSDAESQTYTIQIGRYIKIGSMVTITGTIAVSSLGSLTTSEQAHIGGLPFTSENTANYRGGVSMVEGLSLAIGAGNIVSGEVVANTDYITLNLWDSTSGVTAMTVAEYSVDGVLSFHGTYFV